MGSLLVRGTVWLWIYGSLRKSRWNSSLALASYLDSSRILFRNKLILGLGAGGGLPSIVAAINGARKVIQDEIYPVLGT